jgi:lactoylglutathione lyase
MSLKIGYVTLLVRDYDEAIAYFRDALGFELVEDRELSAAKRWVLVSPRDGQGTCLLLAKAEGAEQARHVGKQSGGRVFLFLHTDDFRRDYELMKSRGVAFEEEPRLESYGTVAVFADLYGNRWDRLQLDA